MGVRVITTEDIREHSLCTTAEAIEAVESAFEALATGAAESAPRQRLSSDAGGANRDQSFVFNNHVGIAPGRGVMAVRVNPRVREIDGRRDAVTYPRDTDFTLLFDIETTEPLALLHNEFLSPLRVGATTALGTKYLARTDAREHGLLGTGNQAREHVRAIAHVREIERCRVFSPTPASRESFVRALDGELPLEVEAVSDPERAVEDADVVTLATNASEPVIDGEWLEPGTHVNSIVGGDRFHQRQELDDRTMEVADTIAITDLEVALKERQGDIIPRLDANILTEAELVPLTDLVSDDRRRRSDESATTVFKNNTGMGIQFAAVGAEIFGNAERAGVGQLLPSELFADTRARI